MDEGWATLSARGLPPPPPPGPLRPTALNLNPAAGIPPSPSPQRTHTQSHALHDWVNLPPDPCTCCSAAALLPPEELCARGDSERQRVQRCGPLLQPGPGEAGDIHQ